MYCNKCGTEIPDDSLFCIKCGYKIETSITQKGESIKKKLILNKIANNLKFNGLSIVICVITLFMGISIEQKSMHKITYYSKMIELQNEIIKLDDSNPILGGSYSDIQELGGYKSNYNKNIFLMILGGTFIVVSVIVGVYMVYNLMLIRKKRRN